MDEPSLCPIESQNLNIPCQEQLNQSINISSGKSRDNMTTPSKLIISRK